MSTRMSQAPHMIAPPKPVHPRTYMYRGGVGLRMGAMTTLTQPTHPVLTEKKRTKKSSKKNKKSRGKKK